MSSYILSYKLWESISFTPGIRVPEQIELTDDQVDSIKSLNWQDLDWKDIGNDGDSIIWLEISTPLDFDISKGTMVDIQLIGDALYQIHISLAEDLRGKGLGTKIYRSLIEWAGHLYSGKGRRQNPIIDKVWDGLKREEGVSCASNDLGDICVSHNNPDGEELLKYFKSI